LLLTDMVMAHIRGTELAALLRRFYPAVKTVYMSGYQDYGASDRGLEKGCLYVQKPFSRDALLEVIAQALEADRLEERAEEQAEQRAKEQGQEEALSNVQAMVTVPVKARRKASRRSRRPLAV
jgi:DNA-binding NtrC family response regulator